MKRLTHMERTMDALNTDITFRLKLIKSFNQVFALCVKSNCSVFSKIQSKEEFIIKINEEKLTLLESPMELIYV